MPHAAALCTWTRLLAPAKEVLEGSGVKTAAVAGDFPSGRAPVPEKMGEISEAISAGADEVDVVIDRSALHEGRFRDAYDEVVAFREAASEATLKVILETGELDGLDLVRRGALVALAGGADMVKTSTGKASRGASLDVAQVLLDALRDFEKATGRRAGLKVAGGIRRIDQAAHYAGLVRRAFGSDGFAPERFRIGASSLLDVIVKALSPSRAHH